MAKYHKNELNIREANVTYCLARDFRRNQGWSKENLVIVPGRRRVTAGMPTGYGQLLFSRKGALDKYWFNQLMHAVENIAVDKAPDLKCFDLDKTVIEHGLGATDAEVLALYEGFNNNKPISTPLMQQFKDRIPSFLLQSIHQQKEKGDFVFIVSHSLIDNALVYQVLKQRCEEENIPVLFDQDDIVCFREEDSSQYEAWANKMGKNIHIIMAFLSYFENLVGSKALEILGTKEEKREWKRKFATTLVEATFLNAAENLEGSMAILNGLLVAYTCQGKIRLYDDDEENCQLAINQLRVISHVVSGFNLATILNPSLSREQLAREYGQHPETLALEYEQSSSSTSLSSLFC